MAGADSVTGFSQSVTGVSRDRQSERDWHEDSERKYAPSSSIWSKTAFSVDSSLHSDSEAHIASLNTKQADNGEDGVGV